MKATKESSTNLVPYLAAGGLGLVVMGAVYYFFGKNETQAQSASKGNALPKDQVLKILTELKRNMYPYFKRLSQMGKGIAEDNQNGYVPLAQIKNDLLTHNKSEVEEITREVLAKHGVKEADFEYSCTEAYKDDKDVKQKLMAIQEEVDKAVQGMDVDNKATLPDFLTPQKTLDISVKNMKASLVKISEKFDELKEQGVDISLKNPRVMMMLKDLRIDNIRAEVLRKEGLDGYEDHPEKILNYAVAKFEKIDPTFRQKLAKLESQHMMAMQKIFQDAMDKTSAIDNVGAGITGDDVAPMKFGRAQSVIREEVKEAPKLQRLNTTARGGSSAQGIENIKKKIQEDFKKALEKSNSFKGKEGVMESALESLMDVMSGYKPETILGQTKAQQRRAEIDKLKASASGLKEKKHEEEKKEEQPHENGEANEKKEEKLQENGEQPHENEQKPQENAEQTNETNEEQPLENGEQPQPHENEEAKGQQDAQNDPEQQAEEPEGNQAI